MLLPALIVFAAAPAPKITVQLPVVRSKTVVAAAALRDAKTWAAAKKVWLLSAAKRDANEPWYKELTYPYTLEITSSVSTDHPSLQSYRLMAGTYTGGAHGNGQYFTVNKVMTPAGQGDLMLSQLFLPGIDYRAELAKVLHRKLSETNQASSLDDGTVSAENALSSAQWTVSTRGIEFGFDNYAVGSFAEGMPIVTVPFSELIGLNPAGPLRFLLK